MIHTRDLVETEQMHEEGKLESTTHSRKYGMMSPRAYK
jgi:hypothetical protein